MKDFAKDYTQEELSRLTGRITDILFASQLGYDEQYFERKKTLGETAYLTECACSHREAIWSVITMAGICDMYIEWKRQIVNRAMQTHHVDEPGALTREMIVDQIQRYIEDKSREYIEDLKKELNES